ncbi:MAG: glucosaminidase domain-containing protein [Candidatus Njordarchaeales archaeon]
MPIFTEGYEFVVRALFSNNYKLNGVMIPNNVKIVVAGQWALESGWGKSLLATSFNNYGGLKYRSDIANYAKELIDAVDYKDWLERMANTKFKYRDDEIFVKNIIDFPLVYFAFLERDRYKGIEDNLHNAGDYLSFLVEKGYVADMPGIKKENILEAYLEKIFNICQRPYFRKLCDPLVIL